MVFPKGLFKGHCSLLYIYVNDLPLCADSNFTLFADDTTILEKIPSFDLTRLNGSIEKIDKWIKENTLKCNVDKSKAVVFGNNVPSELSFGVHKIKPQLKYLGIVIDEKLTFSDHCARVKNIVVLQLHCSESEKFPNKISIAVLL